MNKALLITVFNIINCWPKHGRWWHVDNVSLFTDSEINSLKNCEMLNFTNTGDGFKISINADFPLFKDFRSKLWLEQEKTDPENWEPDYQ